MPPFCLLVIYDFFLNSWCFFSFFYSLWWKMLIIFSTCWTIVEWGVIMCLSILFIVFCIQSADNHAPLSEGCFINSLIFKNMFFYPQTTVKKNASASTCFWLEKTGSPDGGQVGRMVCNPAATLVRRRFGTGVHTRLWNPFVNFFIKKY